MFEYLEHAPKFVIAILRNYLFPQKVMVTVKLILFFHPILVVSKGYVPCKRTHTA